MPWYVTIGKTSAAARAVTANLDGRGFTRGPPAARDPGIVVLSSPANPDLIDALGAAATAGARVVVASLAAATCEPWAVLSAGADDVMVINGDRDVEAMIARVERWSTVEKVLDSSEVRAVVRGDAPTWRDALRQVIEVARFTASPLLLTGETGTGKEVVARLVHALDPRSDIGELVLVDCTTVVPSLSGSEFFGHERGAFTGATIARAGAFARADGGTLFLDEVGELPIALQAELLRVVQEGMYKPVGGDDWESTSFRLIAATNRNLAEERTEGRFRSDFYFRLAGAIIHLPPLRDRGADIVPLFRHFFAEARGECTEPDLDPAVARLLTCREYPGNVRDLRQLAVRAAARHVGDGPVTPGDIPPGDRPPMLDVAGCGGQPTKDNEESAVVLPTLELAIRLALAQGFGLKELKALVPEYATRIALAEAGGPTAAARLLGVSRRAVAYRKSDSASSRPAPDND